MSQIQLPYSQEGYASCINRVLKALLIQDDPFVLFGQNVSAGSCLSGVTRGLQSTQGLEMFNTPNCENAMVGFGFGMMIRGVNSAFVVKQHDFLLLTIDHMVNTYNMIKLQEMSAAFTIVCVVVDSGFEGPQSRLNNLGDFSSIADIPTYSVSTVQEAESILPLLKEPGFRIIALSQRMFRTPMLQPILSSEMDDKQVLYRLDDQKEPDMTVVSMNFSLPQSLELQALAAQSGRNAEVFSVTNALPKDFSAIIDAAQKTKKVVIIDDSRSINRSSDRLHLALLQTVPDCQVVVRQRSCKITDIVPNADVFEIDSHEILAILI